MRESRVIKRWEDAARREQMIESLLAILQDKFGLVPADLPDRLQAIEDLTVLDGLLLPAVRAGSLDDFQMQIANGTQNNNPLRSL